MGTQILDMFGIQTVKTCPIVKCYLDIILDVFKKVAFAYQYFFSPKPDEFSSPGFFPVLPFFESRDKSNTFLNRICSVHGKCDMLIKNFLFSLQRFSYFCHVRYSQLPISQPPDSHTSLVVQGPLTFILTLSMAPIFGFE